MTVRLYGTILGLLTGLALSVVSGGEARAMEQCSEVRELDAESYWFWEAYAGVTQLVEQGTDLVGRLANSPDICFRVSREGLDQGDVRTRGYREAVEAWFDWIPIDESEWEAGGQIAEARKHVKALLGRDFESRSSLTQWWAENHEFLRWSGREGHLVVDEDAKRRGAPVAESFLDLTAEEFWRLEAKAKSRDAELELEERAGSLVGESSDPHGGYRFRVPKEALNDRAAKQRGYISAVRDAIEDGLALPEAGPESQRIFMERLSRLTDRSFDTREDWLSWWERNKDRLVLAEDGQILVTRE